jgi:mRNA interferase RelE/StbE
MIYSVEFLEDAKKEWDRLDNSIRQQFSKKLLERRENPLVQKDESGLIL